MPIALKYCETERQYMASEISDDEGYKDAKAGKCTLNDEGVFVYKAEMTYQTKDMEAAPTKKPAKAKKKATKTED